MEAAQQLNSRLGRRKVDVQQFNSIDALFGLFRWGF